MRGAFLDWELIVLFLLGLLSAPMPLSVPPLPEDQNLLRATPAESLAFVSWFGRAKANPASQNKTERLAAEPQVRSLVLTLGKALRRAWEIEARNDAELAGECFNLLALAAERPGCLFLAGVDLPPQPFSIRAGLVSHLGPAGALAMPTLRKLEEWFVAAATRGAGTVEVFEPVPGLRFRGLPVPPDAPRLSWGVVDGYLVLALGEGMAQQIARGLRGEGGDAMTQHAMFREVQAKVRVARPCFRTFIDLQKIVAMAGAAGGRDVVKILEFLGLTDLQAILSETGLEGEGFVARSMLATKGRSGLLQMVGGAPLTAEELAVIPGDATFATAMRLSPKALYDHLLRMMGALEPRAPEQFKAEVIAPLEQATGLDLQKDLLAHLGDSVALWNSPGQGGLLFTGATLALELGDGEAFGKSFTKAMGSLAETMPKKERSPSGRLRRSTYLETTRAGGTRIWYLNTVGHEMPFAPAWCVTERHLLFSLFPQMLRATVERGTGVEGSLAQHPRVQNAKDAVALSLFDVPAMFDSLYPAVHLLAQLAAGELQREGFDITIAALPTAGSIRPHVTQEVSSLTSREDGLLLTRQGSIPILDPVLGFAVPMLGAAPMVMMQQRALMRANRARAAAEQARMQELQRKLLEDKRKQEDKQRQKKKDTGLRR